MIRLGFVALIAVIFIGAQAVRSETGLSPDVALKIHQEVNRVRKTKGLQPLKLMSSYSDIAAEHSKAMANGKRGFSHDNFDKRVSLMREIEPRITSAAENVAKFQNADNFSARVVEGWMKSPHHKENIVGKFTETGVAVAVGKDKLIYITQVFAFVDPNFNPNAPKRPATVEDLQDFLK